VNQFIKLSSGAINTAAHQIKRVSAALLCERTLGGPLPDDQMKGIKLVVEMCAVLEKELALYNEAFKSED
jgi:hypothetical protein